jgi:hypothetical protein
MIKTILKYKSEFPEMFEPADQDQNSWPTSKQRIDQLFFLHKFRNQLILIKNNDNLIEQCIHKMFSPGLINSIINAVNEIVWLHENCNWGMFSGNLYQEMTVTKTFYTNGVKQIQHKECNNVWYYCNDFILNTNRNYRR